MPGLHGINVIGYVSGNLGLGVAARATVARLLAWQHPVAVVDLDPHASRARHDATFEALECSDVCPHPTNVFHLNPPEVITFSEQWRPHVPMRSINVCVPFWELPRFPVDWLPILGAMDLIMAPTRFIQEAIERDMPSVRVMRYPQTVSIPEGVRADRARWGMADGVVTFLVAFEPASDTARKNPWGAVEAFQRAFPTDDRVALLVKINRNSNSANPSTDLLRLQAVAESDPRIRLFEERLSYVDVLSLYASADAMVSLHRSEGLGLHLMEAMSLGMPVIATGWSGNMDFMTPDDSCLVGYDLVRVRSEHSIYGAESGRPGQVWAEPDIDDAVTWMRRLVDDNALRLSIGARAEAAMREWTAAVNAASPFLEIEKMINTGWSPERMWRHAAFIGLVWRHSIRRRVGRKQRDLKARRAAQLRRIKKLIRRNRVRRLLGRVKRRILSVLRMDGPRS